MLKFTSRIVSCCARSISGIIESTAVARRGLVSRLEETVPTRQAPQLVLKVRLSSLGILVMVPHFALQGSCPGAANTFSLIVKPVQVP